MIFIYLCIYFIYLIDIYYHNVVKVVYVYRPAIKKIDTPDHVIMTS